MAVTSDKYDSNLLLEVITGVDEKGNEKTKSKTISKINVNALDDDLFDIAIAMSKVLKYELAAVRRVDKNLLLN